MNSSWRNNGVNDDIDGDAKGGRKGGKGGKEGKSDRSGHSGNSSDSSATSSIVSASAVATVPSLQPGKIDDLLEFLNTAESDSDGSSSDDEEEEGDKVKAVQADEGLAVHARVQICPVGDERFAVYKGSSDSGSDDSNPRSRRRGGKEKKVRGRGKMKGEQRSNSERL